MHTGRYYLLRDVVIWIRREAGVFVLISGALTALYALAGWKWLMVAVGGLALFAPSAKPRSVCCCR